MKKTLKRILCIALSALTLLMAVPALAATGSVAANTPVYTGASTAQLYGTLQQAGQVTILGEYGDFYQISDTSGITGYVLKSAVTMDTAASSSSSTPAATPAANAGYVTGVKNDAPLRAEASKSSTLVENVPANSALLILTTSGDYTQVTTAAGNTGFILSKYVAYGTPGAPAAAAASAGDVALETPQQMVSASKTIIMRKTPDKSTKSSNVVKKITGAKGQPFTIIATNGSTWYKATYGDYTGYVLAADMTAPSAAGTLAAGAYATGDKAKDKWGEIVKIDGTNIGTAFNKLYDNSIYCNGLNKKNQYYYNDYSGTKNYFYMLSPQGAPVHVLMSHNMRSSKTGGHYLHHIQNAWLGVAKCESCKGSCASAKTSIFYINYNGKTQWQLIGFYEGNESMRNYAAVNYGVTASAKQGWIDQMLAYSTSSHKGATLGSATASDDVMSFITCGDKGSKGGTYLCMLLKAVA